MESEPLFAHSSNSVRLMDSICRSSEKACALHQTDCKCSLFSLLESNKENIDLRDTSAGVKNKKFNANCVAVNIGENFFFYNNTAIKEESLESTSKFICLHCQAIFSQQNHMNYHIKIVHKIHDSVPNDLSVEGHMKNVSVSLKAFNGESLSKSDGHRDNVNESYNCSKCSYVSTSNMLLVKHLQDLHNISKKHPCPECDETFSYIKYLSTHIKSKHCHILCYTCPKCPLTFHSRTTMKNHFFKKHSTSKEIFCQLCFEPFFQHINLKKHFMTVHNLHGTKLKKALNENPALNKNLELIEDDFASINDKKKVKGFDKSTDFNSIRTGIIPASSNFETTHSADSVVSDEYEERSLANETLTTDDIVSGNISFDKFANEYSCCMCLSTFTNKEDSMIHLKDVHPESNNHMCFDCNKFFPQTSLLHDHIDSLHKSLNIFTCDICQDSFFSKSSVITHLKKCMLNLKSFKQSFCDLCSTVFVSKENLVQHIKSVHQKIKPFSCTDCGKSFYSRQKVQRHARAVHEKLKPYGCHECDKFFSTTGNRKQHIDSVHKNIRLHTCEICFLSFSNRASMKQHITSVHMKIKPYKCSYCGSSFSLKVVCQQHEYSVHLKLKLYKCEKCGASYGWQRSLSKHRCSVAND